MKACEIRAGASYGGKPPKSSQIRRVTFIADGLVGYLDVSDPERLFPAVKLRSFARWAGRSMEGGPDHA